MLLKYIIQNNYKMKIKFGREEKKREEKKLPFLYLALSLSLNSAFIYMYI